MNIPNFWDIQLCISTLSIAVLLSVVFLYVSMLLIYVFDHFCFASKKLKKLKQKPSVHTLRRNPADAPVPNNNVLLYNFITTQLITCHMINRKCTQTYLTTYTEKKLYFFFLR